MYWESWKENSQMNWKIAYTSEYFRVLHSLVSKKEGLNEKKICIICNRTSVILFLHLFLYGTCFKRIFEFVSLHVLLLHSSTNTKDKEIIFRAVKQWKKAQEQHKYLRTRIANRDHQNLGESACSTIARRASLDRLGNKHLGWKIFTGYLDGHRWILVVLSG